jgi:hypothetical protein
MLVATLGTPLLTGCFWPRFFDLAWDEEVQLHDKRVIVVKVKYTYERLDSGLTFNRYEPSILRNAELSFDAGAPIGVVTQLFIHQRPMLLDSLGGEWFVVLQGRAGQAVQDWGMDQNGNGQRTAHLVGTSFKPTPISRLPAWMSAANILMDYAPKDELATFNATRLTLTQKSLYMQKYPLAPIDMRIERPRSNLTS